VFQLPVWIEETGSKDIDVAEVDVWMALQGVERRDRRDLAEVHVTAASISASMVANINHERGG